jgi:hypothetical protein
MCRNFGSRAADLRIAIGPCIAKCCFDVGPEVAEQFAPLFPDEPNLSRIDLVEANRRLLQQAGVNGSLIDASFACTMCSPEEFHSYRRDREGAGRMVSAIAVGEK